MKNIIKSMIGISISAFGIACVANIAIMFCPNIKHTIIIPIIDAITNPIVPINDLWFGRDMLYLPYFLPTKAANASPKHILNTPKP